MTFKRDIYTYLMGKDRKLGIRYTTLILFFFLMSSTVLYAQDAKVSISLENASFKQLFESIEKQTKYRFSYRDADVAGKEPISVSAKDQMVSQLLKSVLPVQKLQYSLNGNKIIVTPLQQQLDNSGKKVEISGIVKDDSGEPLIGVSVAVPGISGLGTITDIDGGFSLKQVPENANIQVSYIGYQTQELLAKASQNKTIIMREDTEMLDEVVIVGFGSQKKVNMTGAVTTVSSDVFKDRPVQNATMALQGAVPGLNISRGTGTLDEAPSVNVRGLTTIGKGSSGSPLILIDGMEGDLNMINPQDIENISILKDAAASSIYGSRAPFGVILVTTKNGAKNKFSVNYNNSFRWNTPTRRPHTVDSYRFATYFNDAAVNGKKTGKFTPERMQRIRDYMDGKITTVNIPDPNNPANWADGYDNANANVDWYDEIYDNWSFAQEHTAAVNGGSEKVQMYASLNYLDENGQVKVSRDTYKRYATNLKVTSQITDYLDLNFNMKYSRSDYDRPARIGNVGGLGYMTWPMLPVYDDNGYLFDSPSPILGLREGGRDKTRKDVMTQQLQARIRPLSGWEIVGELNYSINRNRNHWDTQKTYKHNVAGNVIPNADNSAVYEYSYSDDYLNPNVYTTYSREFAGGHNMKVMAGFQSEQKSVNEMSASRDGIMVPGMDVIDITNGTDGNGKPTIPGVGGSRKKWGVVGFFGRLNYDYKGRYLIEANVRHDGSSRFRSDKRWKTFPSVSLGWNIAREAFWGDLEEYASTFKIRASYGLLGNQNTDLWYPTYVTMPVGTSDSGWLINGNKQNTANAPGLISSTLTWETVELYDIGLDADLFKNRLNFTFDWYQRDTRNMVGPAPEMPVILGTAVPTTNNTDLRTRGWEIAIRWRDNLTKDLSYNVAFNLSDDHSTILNYPNETLDLEQYYTGQNVGDIWGYETIGIAKTQEEMDRHLASLPNGGQDPIGTQWEAGDIMYKDLNGDGVINGGGNTLNDHGDKKVIGNNTPRYRFGLNLGASWKGLDVSAFFQGVMKRDYWEGSYNFWGYGDWLWRSTAYEQHMDYFRSSSDHYMGQNLDAYYPRPIEGTDKNHKTQSRYLQNGAYIRLKNIQVGYSLPQTVLNKIHITNLRVFLSGENLWVGSGLSEIFDPEALGKGTSSIGYPLAKTISTGISITL